MDGGWLIADGGGRSQMAHDGGRHELSGVRQEWGGVGSTYHDVGMACRVFDHPEVPGVVGWWWGGEVVGW